MQLMVEVCNKKAYVMLASGVRCFTPSTLFCVVCSLQQGDKWELYIPYELAYGEAGRPPKIPPFSTLLFTMEIVSIPESPAIAGQKYLAENATKPGVVVRVLISL
jgi:hypothetical protein